MARRDPSLIAEFDDSTVAKITARLRRDAVGYPYFTISAGSVQGCACGWYEEETIPLDEAERFADWLKTEIAKLKNGATP